MKRLVAAWLLAATMLGAAELPPVFVFSAANLAATRQRLAQRDPALLPALDGLKRSAETALQAKPLSVMDKPLTAVSGDKHDYFSYGPYWWPDPAKPDGLPYIRRDGEVNPASKQGTDDHPFGHTCDLIETLGLAYWFTGDERYAAKAAQLARVWFLDPATRMNPHLDYAQAIPGINHGRGIGIIESRQIGNVADSIALLAGSPAWNAADASAMRTWLGNYYRWLTTSANGLDEQDEHNNHGSWYDVQAAHLALVLGKKDAARKILTEGLRLRLAAHIQPDGSQPHELARTKSLGYSLFNLEALFACAQLAETAGVDWWNFTTPDGRSLHAALAYLAPYADPAKPWIKQDVESGNRGRLLPLFARYLAHRDDAQFRSLYGRFAPQAPADARWRLLWPAPAAR
jgi:hypothetical protein